MTHFTSPDFWTLYERLPENIRRLADKNYDLLKEGEFYGVVLFTFETRGVIAKNRIGF